MERPIWESRVIKPTLCCCKQEVREKKNQNKKKERAAAAAREREKIGFLEFPVQS
jgi:hypothetical protein